MIVMMSFMRLCDECNKTIEQHEKSGFWGNLIVCSNCYEKLYKEFMNQNEEFNHNYITELKDELLKVGQENKKLRSMLIHYLGELKIHYSRPDSKRLCEILIEKLENENF
jgi:hypothetical protein